MKSLLKLICVLISSSLLPGCATIVGGSKYYAHVVAVDKPGTKIFYQGEMVGIGFAHLKLKRNEANKFAVTLKHDGCPDQTFKYVSRTFRGWTCIGTLISWTGFINGVPVPFGLLIDLATGAVWKPNVREKGVVKVDYKHFKYMINYGDCTIPKTDNKTNILDVLYLKNGSIIKGVIIEQIPSVHVKLQTKDGNLLVFQFDEIDKITREQIIQP